MSTYEVGKLTVRIGADASGLESALDKSKKSLDEVGKRAAEASSKVMTLGEGPLAALKVVAVAATAAAGAAAALVAKSMAAVDAQADLAQQLNTTSASLAAVTRAGDLAGLSAEKVAAGSRALSVRLSQAAAGAGPAADALKQLGLSAEELYALPLDQRIEKINGSIAEHVPVSQRAAMAAKFFGEEAGVAFAQLDATTLAQAREETEALGLAISEVDAAKITAAGDAFATLKMGLAGFGQQLTAQLAPAIGLIGERFFGVAKEAGGMKNAAGAAADFIVNAMALVANAVSGVWRAVKMVFGGLGGIISPFVAALEAVIGVVAKVGEGFIRLADLVPGVDLTKQAESFRQFSNSALRAEFATNLVNKGLGMINNALSEPLAGTSFVDALDEAKKKAEAAAKAAAEARAAVSVGSAGSAVTPKPADSTADDDKKRQEQEKQAALDKVEQIKRALDQEYAIRQEYAEKMAAISASGGDDALAEKVKADTDKKLQALSDEQAAQEAAKKARIDSILSQYDEEYAIALEKDARMAELDRAAKEASLIGTQTYEDLKTAIEEDAAKKRQRLADAEKIAKLEGVKTMFSNLTSLMSTGSRKLFEIGKAAALSGALVSGYAAAVDSYKVGAGIGGPVVGAAFAATSAVATAAQIAQIRSQTFGGGGGGGGAAPSASATAPTVASAQAEPQARTFRVEGLSPGQIFTGDTISSLLKSIEDAAGDGRTRIMVA